MKRLCFGTYLFKRTYTATEVRFKVPDLTEGIAFLTTARSTSHLVLSCDLTRFGSGYMAVSTVMHYTWIEEDGIAPLSRYITGIFG